jgi:hypothetical protein
MKSGQLLFVLVFSLLLFTEGFVGCGKKADPKPFFVSPPKTISDLSVRAADAGIVLQWTIPYAKEGVQNYKIMRNELSKEEPFCKDCPRELTVIADISSPDPLLLKVGENIVSYRDSRVKADYIYTYRVIACDVNEQCGEASNVGEITIRPDNDKQRSK